jgi:hypothetical protein
MEMTGRIERPQQPIDAFGNPSSIGLASQATLLLVLGILLRDEHRELREDLHDAREYFPVPEVHEINPLSAFEVINKMAESYGPWVRDRILEPMPDLVAETDSRVEKPTHIPADGVSPTRA